jgi:hypothetical protein
MDCNVLFAHTPQVKSGLSNTKSNVTMHHS